MAQQTLNIGSNANDGTGDTLRAAMDKVNDNFNELYASPLFSGNLSFSGNEISATRTNDDIVFVPAGTGSVSFPAIKINDNNICDIFLCFGLAGMTVWGTDNGHPERAFFQKFETFGLGQTNWAEILGCILAISSQTIGYILAL